ncbi:MAG: hypothetical protein ACREF0_20275 [Acetobacteraceae bacterium]
MSKTSSHRRFRLIAALALALTACAVAASPADAAPPIGTQYCMDGTETFSTWDAASQHVTDKVVNQYGGAFTAGEVDPANIGRDAVRQYWDAIETSDATGNYGVDTTIPNYIVHHISLGACPIPPENTVFLCYSKFQVDPGPWLADQAQELMQEGYWTPSAMNGDVEGGTNIADYHLVCNPPPPALSSSSHADPTVYVGADGTHVGSAAAGLPGYYPYLGY